MDESELRAAAQRETDRLERVAQADAAYTAAVGRAVTARARREIAALTRQPRPARRAARRNYWLAVLAVIQARRTRSAARAALLDAPTEDHEAHHEIKRRSGN